MSKEGFDGQKEGTEQRIELEMTNEQIEQEIQRINKMITGLDTYLLDTGRVELSNALTKKCEVDYVTDPSLQKGSTAKESLEKIKNLFDSLKKMALDAGVTGSEISDDNLLGYNRLTEVENDIFARKLATGLTEGAYPGEVKDKLEELNGDLDEEYGDKKKPN